jgi:hypothetical protein
MMNALNYLTPPDVISETAPAARPLDPDLINKNIDVQGCESPSTSTLPELNASTIEQMARRYGYLVLVNPPDPRIFKLLKPLLDSWMRLSEEEKTTILTMLRLVNQELARRQSDEEGGKNVQS